MPAHRPAPRGPLQRKCACGNHNRGGGECVACSTKNVGLQRKLMIGGSNDPLEQEADRAVEQVLATTMRAAVGGARPSIHRHASQPTGQLDAAPDSVDQVLANPGRPLEPALRLDMEQRFGHDFSRVRVHSGAAAEQSARDVSAHAYTVGQNIVFGAGRLAPGMQEGRRLLAHELAHVVQQSDADGRRADQDNAKRELSPARGSFPVGNQVTTAPLRRSEITTGSAAVVRFTLGADVAFALAAIAWSRTLRAPLDDQGIALLREVALQKDESVDDNERMFIAALLDPANATKWHAEGAPRWGRRSNSRQPPLPPRAGHGCAISDAPPPPRGCSCEDPPDEAGRAMEFDRTIVDLAGPFAATARDALAIADQANMRHEALYFAMLNGASDSTPGDRAFAGAVYAIARHEGLSIAADLMAGRFKVDQVARASLPKNAAGMYQPTANPGGWKGDTLYLPSDQRFLSLEGQATIVHELTHASQDASSTSSAKVPVVDAELPALRAEAAFYLDAIAKRSGPARERAVLEIAKAVRLPALLCAVLEATEVLENATALAALKELHAKVQSDGYPATALSFGAAEFAALLGGLTSRDEDLRGEANTKLEKMIHKAIASDYTGIEPGRDDGFRGESALDATAGAGPGAPRLQRQPDGGGDKRPAVDKIRFIVGGDVTVEFVQRAKKLAKRRIAKTEELELHDLALKGDDTVSDAERLFIAALADPANAKRVAEAKTEVNDEVELSFPRDTATRTRVREVSDLRRPGFARDVTAARDETLQAGLRLDFTKAAAAFAKAERAAEAQILKLAGSAKGRARDVLAFARERGILAHAILEAMINGGSDSTAGDMVAAGAVYAIAEAAGHELADALRRGRIKVDQKKKLDSGVEGFEARALYVPTASDLRRDHGPSLLKGDTMYVPSSFDIDNLADRGTVIHELQHANDDRKAAATGPLAKTSVVELEVAAYTAGARYTLQEIQRQPTGKTRTAAIAKVAEQWDGKRVAAAALASRTDPRSTPGKWIEVKGSALQGIAREVFAAVTDKRSIESTIGSLEDLMPQKLEELVSTLKGEITRGGAVDPSDQIFLDSLSGESMLDTIDRRPPPSRGP